MSSQEYKMQVIGASRRVETVITEISLTKDRSEVFDFERRAMEAAQLIRGRANAASFFHWNFNRQKAQHDRPGEKLRQLFLRIAISEKIRACPATI